MEQVRDEIIDEIIKQLEKKRKKDSIPVAKIDTLRDDELFHLIPEAQIIQEPSQIRNGSGNSGVVD